MDTAQDQVVQLPYSIQQLDMAVKASYDEMLAPFEVSTPQYAALVALDQETGLTSAALARRSFVSAQAMSEVVLALERQGLIVRSPDPHHARRLLISLTPDGRVLLARVRSHAERIERTIVDGLDDDQLELIQEWLSRSAAALRFGELAGS